MYENNLRALYARKPAFGPDQLKYMLSLETEQERLAFLDSLYYSQWDEYESIPLWPAGGTPEMDPAIPGQREPSLIFYPCEEAKGCVLVAPGGGYNTEALDPEGFPEVKALHEAGFAAALLDYRFKPYTQYTSLEDMQRAIRLLRSRAEELGFRPDRLAITGSSAGGHLCTMAAVHWDEGMEDDGSDAVDACSCRPDAAIISYGVFSNVGYPGDRGLVRHTKDQPAVDLDELVSPYTCSKEERRHRVFFSPELNVTPDTPPMFLWQTCDQDDPRQMFKLGTALAENGVRFEAHVFPYGVHGGGLWNGEAMPQYNSAHNARWFPMAMEWLELELDRQGT